MIARESNVEPCAGRAADICLTPPPIFGQHAADVQVIDIF
jgi:hypothetical protein